MNRKIDWDKYYFYPWKHESLLTKVLDALDIFWCFIHMYWILIVTVSISVYLLYSIMLTGDLLLLFVGIIVIAFGGMAHVGKLYRSI